jgi:integrase/recombinase XerC
MIENFLEYLSSVKDASPHTLRNYGIDLRDFFKFVKIPLESIERKHIREYLASLYEAKKTKKTCARKLSSLRSYFHHAVGQKWISVNPIEDIELPKLEKKLPPMISYDQVKVLFDQPDLSDYLGRRDRTMMELLYSSGLRVSELASLDKKDVDFAENLVRLKGKGKKERIVPFTPNAGEWLTKYLSDEERFEKDKSAIFLNRFGSRLTTRSVDRLFLSYLKRSGMSQRITPHTIRHTIATHWLENGMNLKTIQLLLGHSNLATTTIYTQVSTKLKKKVYDETHPRAK